MTVHANTPTTEPGRAGHDLAATQAHAAHYGGTVVAWRTRCDNHDPSRTWDHGYGVRHDSGFVFWPSAEVRDAHRAVYVLDDGRHAVPHYVTGWGERRGEVYLEPFPTNPDGADRRADRPDEPVDYSGWALGPTRAYHLKISDA